MDDDRKKFTGKRGPGARGPAGGPKGGKPGFGKPAGGKPAWKKEGRPAGEGGEKREFRPRRDDQAVGAEAPKRSYRPRAEGDRPFRKAEGDRPFRKPDGDRPFRKRPEGDARPQRSIESGEKREFRPRRDDQAAGTDAPQRSYRPREEGDRPFRKPDGDRPFRKPDGDRPFRKRPEGDARPQRSFEGGEKREFRPRRDDQAAGTDAPKRSYRPREEGDRPFRKPEGDRPFRKPDGDTFRKREDRDGPRRSFSGGGDRPRSAPSRQHERDPVAPEAGERIAKRLARAGISSRRDAEEMIAAGRIKVNGKVLTSPAQNVGPDDVIHVDNELLPAIERTRVFLFHKPAGVVTTNRDPEGRRTVFDVLPEGLPRLITVGRLDINTEGLLLLTNDGGLARMLELPATGWLRRYRARVHGKVTDEALKGLKDGIAVDGVFYGSIEASLDREQGSNAWLTIGLREGKNREVKNVLGALGLEVSRLIRVSFGPFQLGELPEGAVHELKGRMLRDQLGERLIAEAGANFDAPVVAEFSNKPVVRERDRDAAPAERREPASLMVGDGGLIRNRRRDREERRESALGRLQTKPGGFKGAPKGGPKGKRGKEEKPFEPPRSRSSNVWMASGARPTSPKRPTDTDPSKPGGKGRERTGDRPRPPRKDK